MPLALTRHFALHRILPVLMVVLFVRACKWQFNQIRNGNGRQGKYKKFGKAKSSALPLASASEMGEKWHFNGRRTWAWSHDGVEDHGWIQFCAGGVLRTSLCPEGRCEWSLEENGDRFEMTVTVGDFHYVLMLMSNSPGYFRATSVFVTTKQLDISRKNNSRRGPPTQLGRILDVEPP